MRRKRATSFIMAFSGAVAATPVRRCVYVDVEAEPEPEVVGMRCEWVHCNRFHPNFQDVIMMVMCLYSWSDSRQRRVVTMLM